jgi:chemotaxis protein methyltransferase CheR
MSSRVEDPVPRLSADDFMLLRDLVYEHTGLRFEIDARVLFERRLADRVTAVGVADYGAYYKYLRFSALGPAEIDEAVERLTTKETYFLRQEYQLRAFEHEILPRLAVATAESKRLFVWSAGCSTGEEAYTLAILIHRSGLFAEHEVRVIGSDISKTAIARARRGLYRPPSFRAVPPGFIETYFRQTGEGAQVVEEIRRLCHFGQLNLLDAARVPFVGRVDVVFCRNVLIYFDADSRRRVIEAFYERLLPGGYLLLGHSESLLNVTTAFELVHLSDDLVYRKPLTSERWDGAAR